MHSGVRVLIIDDDPAMVEAVQEILEGAGYATAAAHDPFCGLRLAREVKPAAVVCDMVMPNMAGADVFRTLASDPATAGIARILISGRSDIDPSCANAFLQKPFGASEILRLLEVMTARGFSSVKLKSSLDEPQWHG
jgi:CheY-like chemotaxis protein